MSPKGEKIATLNIIFFNNKWGVTKLYEYPDDPEVIGATALVIETEDPAAALEKIEEQLAAGIELGSASQYNYDLLKSQV